MPESWTLPCASFSVFPMSLVMIASPLSSWMPSDTATMQRPWRSKSLLDVGQELVDLKRALRDVR